ncbi:hypothetical protein [Bacillus smithii]|uniref:hypothetical protein n=1 Tax=Bacillus smithii TaxID=1479 RepID=UPI002E244AF7|nr:hypothetical protein [Bacillus smithii]MED4928253.1 hypothetical protein [Bacillus smithii]
MGDRIVFVGLYTGGGELRIKSKDYVEVLKLAKDMYDATGIVHEIKFIREKDIENI